MRLKILLLLTLGLVALGCESQPPPLSALEPPPEPDPATAHPDYWLAKPAGAIVFDTDYDTLWDICGDVARDDLFSLDREDYREGILSTHPLVSKQAFEFWRPDTGDPYAALQNTMQTIRRTIEFQFQRTSGGFTVTPKVVVERLSRKNRRISNAAEYRFAFGKPEGGESIDEYWFATGRDLAMEAELADAINQKLRQ